MGKSSGRPPRSENDILEFRLKVVKHALAIFRGEGFGAVSMRRLAKEVGCTPTTIYAHFDSKTDILRYLWASVLSEMAGEIRRDLELVDQPVERLRTAAMAFVSYWIEHPENFRLVFMSSDVERSDVRTFMKDDGTLAHILFFSELVEQAHPKANNVKARTDALITGMIGIALCTNTIRDYPWTSTLAMISVLLAGVTQS